jgi:hypothetical protein
MTTIALPSPIEAASEVDRPPVSLVAAPGGATISLLQPVEVDLAPGCAFVVDGEEQPVRSATGTYLIDGVTGTYELVACGSQLTLFVDIDPDLRG